MGNRDDLPELQSDCEFPLRFSLRALRISRCACVLISNRTSLLNSRAVANESALAFAQAQTGESSFDAGLRTAGRVGSWGPRAPGSTLRSSLRKRVNGQILQIPGIEYFTKLQLCC